MKRTWGNKIFAGVFLLVGASQSLFAQDYNFSQLWENRTYYNPAYVGLHEGEFNAVLTYRKLWPKFDENFSTIYFSGDMKTYNNYGFGLTFLSGDQGGGFIKSTSVGLAYSWRGMINKEKNMFFQLGVRGTYNNEKLNFNKYIFSGQLHEIYGNIFPQPDFQNIKQKQNYWDFSAGALFCIPVERHYQEFMLNYFGLSFSHFTRPKDNFIEDNYKIPMKFGFQWNGFIRTGLRSLDRKTWLYVCPGLLFENQGDKLMSSSSFNNFVGGADIVLDPLFGGVWYSSQLMNNSDENYKAMIFKFGIKLTSEKKAISYRLAYSYDMSMGNLTKNTEGSHEISINVVYRFNAQYKFNIYSF